MKRLLATLLLVTSSVYAQTDADPSGHWEGTVKAEGLEVRIEADFAKNANGEIIGTLTLPAENIVFLPMTVSVSGRAINFQARIDQPMTGILSDDGKSIAATFSIQGHSIPFSLVRTGEPRIEPPARIGAIAQDLAGTWSATVEANGTQSSIVLTLANKTDGTGTGMMVSANQGGLQVPVSNLLQVGRQVTIGLKSVGGSYAGTLNSEGNEMHGTYTSRGMTMPVTFRRVAADREE